MEFHTLIDRNKEGLEDTGTLHMWDWLESIWKENADEKTIRKIYAIAYGNNVDRLSRYYHHHHPRVARSSSRGRSIMKSPQKRSTSRSVTRGVYSCCKMTISTIFVILSLLMLLLSCFRWPLSFPKFGKESEPPTCCNELEQTISTVAGNLIAQGIAGLVGTYVTTEIFNYRIERLMAQNRNLDKEHKDLSQQVSDLVNLRQKHEQDKGVPVTLLGQVLRLQSRMDSLSGRDNVTIARLDSVIDSVNYQKTVTDELTASLDKIHHVSDNHVRLETSIQRVLSKLEASNKTLTRNNRDLQVESTRLSKEVNHLLSAVSYLNKQIWLGYSVVYAGATGVVGNYLVNSVKKPRGQKNVDFPISSFYMGAFTLWLFVFSFSPIMDDIIWWIDQQYSNLEAMNRWIYNEMNRVVSRVCSYIPSISIQF